jgi:hypothetical protein
MGSRFLMKEKVTQRNNALKRRPNNEPIKVITNPTGPVIGHKLANNIA